jgi:hypothetical protein
MKHQLTTILKYGFALCIPCYLIYKILDNAASYSFLTCFRADNLQVNCKFTDHSLIETKITSIYSLSSARSEKSVEWSGAENAPSYDVFYVVLNSQNKYIRLSIKNHDSNNISRDIDRINTFISSSDEKFIVIPEGATEIPREINLGISEGFLVVCSVVLFFVYVFSFLTELTQEE